MHIFWGRFKCLSSNHYIYISGSDDRQKNLFAGGIRNRSLPSATAKKLRLAKKRKNSFAVALNFS